MADSGRPVFPATAFACALEGRWFSAPEVWQPGRFSRDRGLEHSTGKERV